MDEFTKGLTHPVTRFYLKGRFLAIVIFVALLAIFAFPRFVQAAPKATSETECRFLADMAITAQALAKQGLPLDVQRQILMRIYFPEAATANADPALLKKLADLMNAVSATAINYRQVADGGYAQQLYSACTEKSGDMDSVLGVGV